MRYCETCAVHSMDKKDFYCYKCGNKLEESYSCGCGEELTMFESYCPKCGTKREDKQS